LNFYDKPPPPLLHRMCISASLLFRVSRCTFAGISKTRQFDELTVRTIQFMR
jgi:hypothetical protein